MSQITSLFTFLLACFLANNACSQKGSAATKSNATIFVGSTPCDPSIRTSLGLPPGSEWDHVIWQLTLSKNNPPTFGLTAHYMTVNPKTNAYVDSKIKRSLQGTFKVSSGSPENLNLKVYRLNSENPPSEFFLVEMDSNILHFADKSKNLMVGNSAFGYILNRIQK